VKYTCNLVENKVNHLLKWKRKRRSMPPFLNYLF